MTTHLISSVSEPEPRMKPYSFNFHLCILQVCKKFLLLFVSYFSPRQSEVTLFIVRLLFNGARTEEFSKTFSLNEARGYTEKEHKRLEKSTRQTFCRSFTGVAVPRVRQTQKKNKTERSSDLFWKFLISYRVTEKFLPIQQKFLGVYSTTYHNGRVQNFN